MSYWLKSGQDNLRRILTHRNNENRAKNIIIFIGDGMGISTITAGRIYKGQIKGNTGEEYKLAFEMFPNAGFAKVSYTYTYALISSTYIYVSNQFQSISFIAIRKIFLLLLLLFLQTYNTDKQVPDSAGTATALFSGVKCRYKVIGLDTRSSFNQCDKYVNQASKLTTVADWAQQSGMDTGKRSFRRKRNKKVNNG